jgi:hypothetical protein
MRIEEIDPAYEREARLLERLDSYQLLIIRHDPEQPPLRRDVAEGELLLRGECGNPDCGCHPSERSVI